MTTSLDITRHKELFDPTSFHSPIHIIGVGATGSWVALQLAKLGLENVTLWDDDYVEEHNVPNQAYGAAAVGESKLSAMDEILQVDTSASYKLKHEKVTNQRLAGFVFLMVDSMSARKEIWENCIRMKSAVQHLVEPRMGMSVGRVYNVSPTNLLHVREYEGTYYGDDVAEVSACGASVSVITSAMSVAATCVRQLINWHNKVDLPNEILVDYMYNNIFCTEWGKVERVEEVEEKSEEESEEESESFPQPYLVPEEDVIASWNAPLPNTALQPLIPANFFEMNTDEMVGLLYVADEMLVEDIRNMLGIGGEGDGTIAIGEND